MVTFKQTMQKTIQEQLLKGVVGGPLKAATGPIGVLNKIAGKISTETLGYNFPGLIMNIAAFYIIAAIIDGIFEAIIGGSGFISFIAKLFGKSLPNVLPQPVVDFYNNGWNGIQYWDVVHILALTAVATEGYRYYKSNEETGGKPSYFTLLVFGMIMGSILLLVGPSLAQKLKEIQTLGTTIAETPTTNTPANVGPVWLPVGYSYTVGSDSKYYAFISSSNTWQQAIQDTATTGHLSGINLVRVP